VVVDGGGSTLDAATAVDRPGWVTDEAGIIVTEEGGVIITEDGGAQWQCVPVTCYGNGPLQCGDCVNNDDNDGLIDWRDPECLGPCDDTEGAGLESGVGGTSGNSCGVDCYFDFGNGPGNDDCKWDHRCDPLSPEAETLPACAYDPGFVASFGDRDCPDEQSQQCYDFCKPITPNGCDCFGCCTFPPLAGQGAGGSDKFVWIGSLTDDNVSTCTLDALTDEDACPPCTPHGNCYNSCGHCEICVGKPTLPEDCFAPDAGPVPDAATPPVDAAGQDLVGVDLYQPPPDAAQPDVRLPDGGTPDTYVPPRCEPNVIPCGLPGDAECPVMFYCITGCCVYIGG
jgi:hypothetical protein